MGILEHFSNSQNCIKSTNIIPEYVRDFKKEYLFIRGINKEIKYFVDNINDATTGLFENDRVDRIKYFIKRFLKGQERGKLQDISNFIIRKYDFLNIEEFYLNMIFEEDDNPSYRDFYVLLHEFYNKIKIEFFVSDYYEGGEYV